MRFPRITSPLLCGILALVLPAITDLTVWVVSLDMDYGFLLFAATVALVVPPALVVSVMALRGAGSSAQRWQAWAGLFLGLLAIDIQPGMIERLRVRANKAGVTNLTAILGDATQPHVPEASFDVVFLCTVLGEIPDRAAALRHCFRALKPGGRLSITEMAGDPHYQSRATVQRLAEEAGFRLQSIQGGWWFFTATFIKPLD